MRLFKWIFLLSGFNCFQLFFNCRTARRLYPHIDANKWNTTALFSPVFSSRESLNGIWRDSWSHDGLCRGYMLKKKKGSSQGDSQTRRDSLGRKAISRYSPSQVLELLGRKTYGQVAHCWKCGSPDMFAVKLINKHPAFVKQAEQEVKILDRLRYCALSK